MAVETQWNINRFSIGRKLGEGNFGAVFLVKEKNSSFVMALKMINKDVIKELDFATQLKREIEIQSHLIHSNIIRLYGYFHDDQRVYIMLEYARRGELYDDIVLYRRFGNQRSATYMFQIMKALEYCHSKNVIHRDIKPENILMAKDGQIKLGDFGWSVHNKSGIRRTLCGTPSYMSPEMCMETVYTNKVDIWCLGVLCYEMLTGQLPFDDPVYEDYVENIKKVRFTVPDDVDPMARDLIKMIIRFDPLERPPITEILDHNYLATYSENCLDKCQAALDQWKKTAEELAAKRAKDAAVAKDDEKEDR